MNQTQNISRPLARTLTHFDDALLTLLKDASTLKTASEDALGRAQDSVDSADRRARQAAVHLIGAVANVGLSGTELARGTAQAVVVGGGHALAGVGVGAAGVAVEAGEVSLSLGARVLNAAARGFVSLGNVLTRAIGDGRTATVREIEGHGRGRTSDQLYGVARRELTRSREGLAIAWASYERAMGHALGAGVNTVAAAAYGGPQRWSQRYIGQVMARRRSQAFLTSK